MSESGIGSISLPERMHQHPSDRTALSDGGAISLTYAETLREIQSVREWFISLNVTAVGIAMDNSPAWIVADIALSTLPVAVVPIPPFFTETQRRNAFTKSGCQCCLVDRVHATQTVIARVDIAGREVALVEVDSADADCAVTASTATLNTSLKITFTSGSTGTPKGVRLFSHRLVETARHVAGALDGEPIERHLSVLPLGVLLENIAGVYASLWRGITCVIPPLEQTLPAPNQVDGGFPLIDTLNTYQPSSCIVMPELLSGLVRVGGLYPATLDALTYVAVGGAAVSETLLEQSLLCGIPAYQGYGLSEAGSVVTMNTPSHNKPGTVGRVLPHHQVTIDQSIIGQSTIGQSTIVQPTVERAGEIRLKNPGYSGYTGFSGSTDWQSHVLCTGDLGTIDADGYVTIAGRFNNLLITSMGRNVSPEWIEALLVSHSSI